MKLMSGENSKKDKASEPDIDKHDSIPEPVPTSPELMKIAVPRRAFELRSCYLNGPTVILNNLPTSNIQLIYGHSYVSMRHVIGDFLGKVNLLANIYYSSKEVTKNLADSVISKDVYLRARLNNKCVDLNNY